MARRYRLYRASPHGRIESAPVELSCANDADAVRQSEAFVRGTSHELWDGNRLVRRFSSPSASNAEERSRQAAWNCETQNTDKKLPSK